jgi:hypothetical protein
VSVPANASATQLLAQAQTEFQQADQALAAGNLGSYQAHEKAGRADVQAAVTKLGSTATTTTIPPAARTTTTAPAKTTTTSGP